MGNVRTYGTKFLQLAIRARMLHISFHFMVMIVVPVLFYSYY